MPHRRAVQGRNGTVAGLESRNKESGSGFLLPKKYRKEFAELGIDIDRYGAWWERGEHRQLAWQYNQDTARLLKVVEEASSDSLKLRLIANFMEQKARDHALTVYLLGA